MSIKITSYNAICNLGKDIDTIYENAINGNINCFSYLDGYIKNTIIYSGVIDAKLPDINDENYNLRCNRVILKTIEKLNTKIAEIIHKYGNNNIGIIAATTNSGVEEFAQTNRQKYYELSNPAEFLHLHLKLNGYYTTVSTACSSGLKAFSLARDLLRSDICDCCIVVCVDTLAKVPLYGFNSLEVLSDKPSIPFSKNRCGMNISEACTVFIVEKNTNYGIEIMGIGESSDVYHSTTPDPQAKEAIKAINEALNEAKIRPEDIDYINAHGTGTIANDIMEAHAINSVFSDTVPVSSTKPMTGHCLGAAAGIETALCCKLIENFKGKYYPHMYDGEYDEKIDKIKLVKTNDKYTKCNICMCNSFGFGGTNTILILGVDNEKY